VLTQVIAPAQACCAASEPVSKRVFFGASALLFIVSAAATIAWCASMSAMSEMPMPGGWTMSMAWMRMPGQTWLQMLASFLGMWAVMMTAMMLPTLTPMLWRYRQALGAAGVMHVGRLAALVAMGYFSVWIAFGVAAFALGVALAAFEMQDPLLARGIPLAAGVAILIAGAIQFSAWKARHLACCQTVPLRTHILQARAGTAWRHGLRLGVHCCNCCAGPTTILLVVGVMNLWAMTIVTMAITLERLAPARAHAARAIGVVFVGAGLILIAQTAGAG
jgi:predicted metal-binding membrane protein